MSEFADQFPIVEYDPDRLEPPQVDLISNLIELFEIAGYTQEQIHRNVEKDIPGDAFEPTDFEYGDSLTLPVYIAEDDVSSAYIV